MTPETGRRQGTVVTDQGQVAMFPAEFRTNGGTADVFRPRFEPRMKREGFERRMDTNEGVGGG